jgi:DNA-binding NarL/FixJ family response regulator
VSQPIRVLVADDQQVVREGLGLILDTMDGVDVVGFAANGEEAVAMARHQVPDVVLMDLRMPVVDGVEATRQIRATVNGTQVLILTTYADDESIFPALRAGALGYLTKDASAEEIGRAITSVAEGATHLDPTVQHRLVASILDDQSSRGDGSRELPDALTPRELDVLRLIAAGLSNSEIADSLFVGRATVKTHVNHIFEKTGSRDRVQAVRYAFEHGLAGD